MRRPLVVRLALVLGVVLFAAVSFAFSREARLDSEPAPRPVADVVLFAVPHLGIDDVDPAVMPTLSRLAGEGAIAATNVRSKGDAPNVLDAYGTLGAGNRVAVGDVPAVVPDPGATTSTIGSSDGSGGDQTGTARRVVPTARAVTAAELGQPPDGPDRVVLREMARIVALADAGTDPAAQPGSLATALRAAGRHLAVVTNAGGAEPLDESGAVPAPAGVAAADPDGLIDAGSVSVDLLRSDPDRPGGVTADGGAYAAAVDRALRRADVVVVDPGETHRAVSGVATADGASGGPTEPTDDTSDDPIDDPADGPTGSPAVDPDPGQEPDPVLAEQRRLDALATTDAVLARVERTLGPDTLLVVVGVTPPGDRWALTPMVVSGAGTPRGYLHSSSTHRPDLVTLTDLAPTVLDALGVEVPSPMIGHPLAYRPGEASWSGALALDTLLERRAPIDRAMAIGFIVVQTVVYVLAVVVLLVDPARPRWFDRTLLLTVLTCAAWPLATFVLRIAPSLYSYGAATFLLCWLVAAGVAYAVSRLRTHTLDPVLALCALTATTLVADLATGAHLQYGSFFGYAPTTAPRFTGIGNASFALLGGATVVICTALVARSTDKTSALWAGGAVAAVVVIADGAPWMGADVGGILTLVPVLCLLFWSLSGRRVRWHTIGLAILAAAAVLGVAVVVESLRDPGQRTHIGRFFLSSGDGTVVQDTLARKWSTNMKVLTRSPLAWAVPLIAGVGFVAVASGRAWRRVLPLGSPERTGVTATLAMGFVGWILNDSGVVVLALASVFLGPYILLLAQAANAGARGGGGAAGSVGPPMADEPHEPLLVLPEPSAGDDGPADPVDPLGDPGEPAEVRASGGARSGGVGPTVVALVPAKDRADSVAATVAALRALPDVDRVLVVDDGSTDHTADAARTAGADVVRLPVNRGKGGAVAAGVAASPDADIYLLIDADLARTAAAADLLLGPVLRDEADLVIGVLPSAGGKGGFGLVRDASARGIARGCGLRVRAPLSGQRAVRADLIRHLPSADRFGLEVAMTIDVARGGGRVLEVDVPMDHRHTGRSLAGFAHRARQGRDIARSLWPRVTTARQRVGLVMGITLVACLVAPLLGAAQVPDTTPLGARPNRVVVFGMQPLSFDDLDRGVTPNLQRLIDEGAVGALSARTVARTPTDGEGYLSLGAGARLAGGGLVETVLPVGDDVGGITARQYVASLTGTEPEGEYVVMGGPALLRRLDDPEAASVPGALGDALVAAGLSGAAVGNGDQPATYTSAGYVSRPAGLVVMTSDMAVPSGHLTPEEMLETSTDGPFGVQANADAVVAATLEEVERADVVVVDPGDLSRAARFGRSAVSDAADTMWERSLIRTDAMLGRILDGVDDDTLVLVVSVVPSGYPYRPTPLVAWGPGVPHGRITSPSTRQSGVTAITDLAPTILDALGAEVPSGLPGSAMRYEPGPADLDQLRTLDTDTMVRERTYGPVSTRYIQAFTVLYLGLLVLVAGRRHAGRFAPWLRGAVLALAAFPVATFVVRLAGGLNGIGTWAQATAAALLAVALGVAAGRSRRSALSPLAWITALTVVVIVVDAWTGTHLHLSSWLGYSLHNAGRFYGIPNTTFAVLGACTLLLAGVRVHHHPRRTEAIWQVGCLFMVVVVSAGLPMLGADVGSLVTLVPVFALTLLALSGRRVRLRNLALAGLAMAALVTAAAALDLARPDDQRSHLGRFAEQVLDDGPAAFVDTFARKQEANARLAQSSQWSRMVPVALAFLAVPLAWQRRHRTLLPPGSPTRVAFWAVAAATVLGFASNDSGPIVLALFLAHLPPFLYLLVTEAEVGPPEVLPALVPVEQRP